MNFDFGGLFQKSWDDFVKSVVNLIVFTLVGSLLSMTIILIPTVIGGFTRGILNFVRTGEEPQLSELWNFEDFLQIVLLLLVGGTLVTLGMILCILPGMALCVLWLYSLYYIVDKKMGFWAAMMESQKVVLAEGASSFFIHFIILMIISALNSVGSSLFGIGMLATAPFGLILMAHVYLGIVGEKKY